MKKLLAIGLIALVPLLGRIAPGIFSDAFFGVIGFGAVFAIGALALNVLMGHAGQISLGHGAFVGVGALVVGIITGRLGLAFMVGLPLAAIAGALFALLVGLPALRLRGLYLAISTIAFGEVFGRFIFGHPAVSGGNTGISTPRPRAGTFEFILNADYLVIILLLLMVTWTVDRNLTRTALGRAMHGVREDEQVASSFGVDVPRTKLVAFVVSGALAGVAGAVQGPLITAVQSNVFNFEASLFYLMIVVVGGLGSRVGVAAAAFLFAAMPRWLIGLEEWSILVGALLLVFTVARHPGGIAQALREAAERKRKPLVEEPDADAVPALPRIEVERARPPVDAAVPVLRADDISVRFGGLQALDGAGITVRRGTIAGLIGPNGAGKTTLFNALSGFQAHDSGHVEFLGEDVTKRPAHARAAMGMGRTFQLIGLARNLSVTDNFLLAQHSLAGYGSLHSLAASRKARRSEREMRQRAKTAIHALGFDPLAETPVRNLSGGQQRLVELGCALVTAPELLLLDEPSAGLSPAMTESLAERLREMRDQLGLTILLIEHHIPLVAEVCDDVTVLNLGKPLVSGRTGDVVSDPRVITAYLGEDVA